MHVFPAARSPGFDENLGELLNGDVIVGSRAKVPARAPLCRRLGQHRSGEREIPGERLEHMLPWSHGRRIPHRHRLAGRQVPHDVGHDSVFSPIAATNDVAGSHRCELHAMLAQSGWREEARSIGRRHEFRRSFAGAVGIMAAEPVGLIVRSAVGMGLVALVTRG